MSNMWQDFKFAVDFRAGDTKPVEDKTKDKSEAGTKSIGKEESHYGEIGNDAAGTLFSAVVRFNALTRKFTIVVYVAQFVKKFHVLTLLP